MIGSTDAECIEFNNILSVALELKKTPGEIRQMNAVDFDVVISYLNALNNKQKAK